MFAWAFDLIQSFVFLTGNGSHMSVVDCGDGSVYVKGLSVHTGKRKSRPLGLQSKVLLLSDLLQT